MLKRQRPTTPPPPTLGDPPLLLPDLPARLLQSHTTDAHQHRWKRQRTRPPPLDGALRGWLGSEPAGPHSESDGEEDWVEDAYDVSASPLPLSTSADQYKQANSLLHELHALNQHRLLFAHPHRDLRQCRPAEQEIAVRAAGPSHHHASPQPTPDGPASRSCFPEAAMEKGLVEEVQCVRQRYEDVNRTLGSLFLSRRREVVEATSPAGPNR